LRNKASKTLKIINIDSKINFRIFCFVKNLVDFIYSPKNT
jgi:hypothetical protein